MTLSDLRFSEQFKSMWEEGSDVLLLWNSLEVISSGISERCIQLAKRQASFRPPIEMEEALKIKSEPMKGLYVEWVNQQWNKLLLRTNLKVRDALYLMFHSANKANAYGFALSARAILEHVALLQFFWDQVPWRRSRVVTKKEMTRFTEDILKIILGSRINWEKLTTGAVKEMLNSGQWDRPQTEHLPRIAKLVVSLDNELFATQRQYAKGTMRFLYGILCDVVHPSWGGDFIYSPRMSFALNAEPEFNHVFKLSATMFCLPVVELVKHLHQLTDVMIGEELRIMV
jgi:hypothetical protein